LYGFTSIAESGETNPERSSYTLRARSETRLGKKCFDHHSKRRILYDSKQKTNRNSSGKTDAPNDVCRIFSGSVKARSAISTVVLKSLWKRSVGAAYRTRNKALDPICTKMKHSDERCRFNRGSCRDLGAGIA
jgi:hypothetical protein